MHFFNRLFIVAFAAVIAGGAVQGQPILEGQWGFGLKGAPATHWRASWIWTPEDADAEMVLARKVFALPSVPQRAMLSITASSRYQLYINGAYMGGGPARSAAHHQSYDVLNITSALRPGKNVLAIRTHHQRDAVSYYGASRGGLLAQIDFSPDIKINTIQTDRNWRVSKDESWLNVSPRMAMFHLEVNDRVDLRRKTKEWATVDFDDRVWPKARVLVRETGWPTPQSNAHAGHLIAPWTKLIGRDIPYLIESELKAKAPVSIGSIVEPKDLEAFEGETWVDGAMIHRIKVLNKDGELSNGAIENSAVVGPIIIEANENNTYRVVMYDLGDVKNGRPFLDIAGPAGTVVDVMCAPYLVEGHLISPIVASRYVDRIVLSGQRERWEAFYMKPVRWMAVVFRRLEDEAKLFNAGVMRTRYPFERKGYFSTPDAPELERLWEAAAKTIEVCTTDAYTDNYRERRQYVQTSYYASMGNYSVFGDHALQRRYLKQSAQEQLGDGLMPAYGPRHDDDFMVILDSNCFWIRGLYQYLLYSGDRETVVQLLPAARRLLELLNGYTHERGLIDRPPLPYWLDHAAIDRRGANFVLNALYLAALEDFSKVLKWLDAEGVEVYEGRADVLRRSLGDQFWDAERGLFVDAVVDGVQSDQLSEQTNAMAMALKIAGPEQLKKVARELSQNDHGDFVRRASGVLMTTPALSYFLGAGLCEAGYEDESWKILWDRFGHMLEEGTNGTLWEEWWLDGSGRSGSFKQIATGRSDAQTESAFFGGLFARYILGIEPVAPGLSEVVLRYHASALLHQRRGGIPTPRGLLEVAWDISDEEIQLQLNIPMGTSVKIDLSSLGATEGDGVWAQGEPIHTKQIDDGFFVLTPGDHTVRVKRHNTAGTR